MTQFKIKLELKHNKYKPKYVGTIFCDGDKENEMKWKLIDFDPVSGLYKRSLINDFSTIEDRYTYSEERIQYLLKQNRWQIDSLMT